MQLRDLLAPDLRPLDLRVYMQLRKLAILDPEVCHRGKVVILVFALYDIGLLLKFVQLLCELTNAYELHHVVLVPHRLAGGGEGGARRRPEEN